MRFLDKIRARHTARLLAFATAAALCPSTLEASVCAAFHHIGAQVQHAEAVAKAIDAKFTVLKDFGGVPIGWGMMKMMRGGVPIVSLTIAATSTAGPFNIRTQALAAGLSSTVAANVITTVNALDSGSNLWYGGNTYAIDTGTSWPTGTSLNLVNNGYLSGHGGQGGNGANVGVGNNGFAGSIGGDVIFAQYNLTVDNTNGYILAGCGGGGGGGGEIVGSFGAHGGGGGGGKGFPQGGGGTAGGTGAGGAANGTGSSWGVALSSCVNGAGGAGGNDSGVAIGGAGSPGGGQELGSPTSASWGLGTFDGANSSHGTGIGGAGGQPGNAIRLSSVGIAITWQGGNNGSQVRGAVSV